MDIEKTLPTQQTELCGSEAPPTRSATLFHHLNTRINSLAGFESRGLARVPSSERQPPATHGLVRMLLLWLSANATLLNLAIGLYGPLVLSPGFVDSALCAISGMLLGSLTTAYMSI